MESYVSVDPGGVGGGCMGDSDTRGKGEPESHQLD